MSDNLLGTPPRGTIAWAAQQIQRLLDREEREAKGRAERALIEDAAPFALRDYPAGSDAWAAQQIRLIQQRAARKALKSMSETRARQRPSAISGSENPPYRQTAHRPAPPPSQGLLAAAPTPPRETANDPRLQPVAAAALPWIIGGATQIPAWISRLAPLFGLAPLMRGDTEEDDYKFCFQRQKAENTRCYRWPQRWLHPCQDRARERFMKCYQNGGQPDPEEPPEWGPKDMEEWYNPDR